MKTLRFFYLSAYAHTGGIEKFNRCLTLALSRIAEQHKLPFFVHSVYDSAPDSLYIGEKFFRGHKRNKLRAVIDVIKSTGKSDIMVVGHINLSIAAVLVKLLKPSTKLIIVTHGIEVWKPLNLIQRSCLRLCDKILAVSEFTKNQIVYFSGTRPEKITVFNNTLDPHFKLSSRFEKPGYLLERYGLKEDDKIVLTLSRLVSSERYKGYDKVLEALPSIVQQYPNLKYVLAGKYDDKEFERINDLIDRYGVRNHVILTGFIDNFEIVDHYLLADVFVLASTKEGFGIVFLEALACGVPVIGGNQDGTVEALKNGTLGRLVDPRSVCGITEAVLATLEEGNDDETRRRRQQQLLDNFGFDVFVQSCQSKIMNLN